MSGKTDPFHIDTTVTPMYIFQSIEIIAENDISNNKEFENLALLSGKEISNQKDLSHILAFIKRLGISTENFDLTELGQSLYNIMYDDNILFNNYLHFLFYSQHSLTGVNNSSWVYKTVVDELCNYKIVENIDKNELALKIVELTEHEHELHIKGISFRGQSITPLIDWLYSLDPKCIEGNKTFKTRSFCQPQLFVLAIDYLFSIKKINYGSLIRINDEVMNIICKLCVLDTQYFDQCLELCKNSYEYVNVSIGWGKHIRLNKKPQLVDIL